MHVRTVSGAVRALLLAEGLFVLIAGAQLFVFSGRTEELFAWTISPPLTAAFLGACYWAAGVLVLTAVRRDEWARVRIAVPAVLLFAVLTLGVTIVHFDRFDLDSFFGWAWLVVYVAVPPLSVLVWALQMRTPGGDPPRRWPLPRALRLVLALQAVVLLVAGIALLVLANDWWPWTLTPLTSRAIGAWLVSIAAIAAHVLVEDDLRRVDAAFAAYAALGVLELIAVARYADTLDWPGAWAYVGFVASIAATGLWGVLTARRA